MSGKSVSFRQKAQQPSNKDSREPSPLDNHFPRHFSLSSSVLRRVGAQNSPSPKGERSVARGPRVSTGHGSSSTSLLRHPEKGIWAGENPSERQNRSGLAQTQVFRLPLFLLAIVSEVSQPAASFTFFAVLRFSHLSAALLRRSQRRSGANIHSACRSRRSNLHSSPQRFPIQVLVAKKIPLVHSTKAVLFKNFSHKYQN